MNTLYWPSEMRTYTPADVQEIVSKLKSKMQVDEITYRKHHYLDDPDIQYNERELFDLCTIYGIKVSVMRRLWPAKPATFMPAETIYSINYYKEFMEQLYTEFDNLTDNHNIESMSVDREPYGANNPIDTIWNKVDNSTQLLKKIAEAVADAKMISTKRLPCWDFSSGSSNILHCKWYNSLGNQVINAKTYYKNKWVNNPPATWEGTEWAGLFITPTGVVIGTNQTYTLQEALAVDVNSFNNNFKGKYFYHADDGINKDLLTMVRQ